jgi:hypothetical protein
MGLNTKADLHSYSELSTESVHRGLKLLLIQNSWKPRENAYSDTVTRILAS